MLCEICTEESKKNKRVCNKTCSSKHPICKNCTYKLMLEGCPFCKEDIYDPEPNQEDYLINLGMMNELEYIIKLSETTNTSILNRLQLCTSVNIAYNMTQSISPRLKNMSSNFSNGDSYLCVVTHKNLQEYFHFRVNTLHRSEKLLRRHLIKTSKNIFDSICYMKGRSYIARMISSNCELFLE